MKLTRRSAKPPIHHHHSSTPDILSTNTLDSLKMAPLVPIFSADSLSEHVNIVSRNFQEKRRKGPPVNLQDCPLLEMVQYSCNPPQDGIPQPGVVVCKPVVRLFRRYTLSVSLVVALLLTNQLRWWFNGRDDIVGASSTGQRRRRAKTRGRALFEYTIVWI